MRPSSPHCRGGASSLLRVSSAGSPSSGFGALCAGVSMALARSVEDVQTSGAAVERRLWASATFAGRALWQDTCVAFD